MSVAARFVVDVQTVISREKDPKEFGVVTIGAINGGSVGNIIPDSVKVRGTIRTYNPAVRASETLMALLYPDGHPYGRRTKGSIEIVERLTRADLARFHAERRGAPADGRLPKLRRPRGG